MWAKLLSLLGGNPELAKSEPVVEQNIVADSNQSVIPSESSAGPSSLIGYNYLGKKNEEPVRRRGFINLSKLLRGDYKDEESEETP